MLEDKSVQRISNSPDMEDWWTSEVNRIRHKQQEIPNSKEDKKEDREDGQQWGGTLPGPGGT
jgi:hypothetical protein